MNTETKAVSKEIAIGEIESLINKFVKKPVPADKIEETYPDVLDGIMDGHISFNKDGIPILKLKYPVTNDKGDVAISELTFKTRIKPTVMASIAKGVDMKTDSMTLSLRLIAHIIDQPIAMIDKFERYDYDIIDQLCSVFS